MIKTHNLVYLIAETGRLPSCAWSTLRAMCKPASPLLGHHDHIEPQEGAENQFLHQENPVEDVLSAVAEEVQPAIDCDGTLVLDHRHHRVHPHLLYHHLVRCNHCQRDEQTAAHHLLCREGNQLQSANPPPPRNCTPPRPWGTQERLWPTPPVPDTNSLRDCPPALGCGPSGTKPHTIKIVSSIMPGTPLTVLSEGSLPHFTLQSWN